MTDRVTVFPQAIGLAATFDTDLMLRVATRHRRRGAGVSRIIAKVRGHGLLAKVPGSHIYRATDHGQRVMGLAIRFQLEFPTAMTARDSRGDAKSSGEKYHRPGGSNGDF